MTIPFLEVLSGRDAGKRYELTQSRLRMGRHPECEVIVDQSAVSRYHAQLIRDGEIYHIEDLQSRNRTYLNGKPVEKRTALADKDRIKICDTLFAYHGVPAEPEVSASDDDNSFPTTVLTTLDAQSHADLMVKMHAEAKLRAILELTQAIGKTLDTDELFPKLLESMFQIFPQADRAIIILQQNRKLIPKSYKIRAKGEDSVRFSKTIVQKAIETKKAILSADAANDVRFNMSQSIADFRIRSVMCVPLLSQNGDAHGAIQLDTQSATKGFNEEDLQILASVGTQASIAFDNAKLHQEILKQERIDRELTFAKEVQTGFLPKRMPEVKGYDFWSFYEAAGKVGGDHFDFVKLPSGRLAILIGDVSGKGIPAALLMAKASSDTKVALLTTESAAEAMAKINDAVCEAELEDKFITMVLCLIDPATHKMEIVNAGHMSPMIRRLDGRIEEPSDNRYTGLPVGVQPGTTYNSITVPLMIGDTVVLYTDGINDAMNADHQQYGIEKLRAEVRKCVFSPGPMGEYLIRNVRDHVAGFRQHDDMTFVIFARTELSARRVYDTATMI